MAKKLSMPKLEVNSLYDFEDTVTNLKKKHVQKIYKQNCKHSIFSE